MKIVIVGGSGFIGKALITKLMDQGHSVLLLTRSASHFQDKEGSKLQFFTWNAKDQGAWSQALSGADAVINLTGEGIAGKRWTPTQKRILLQSRTESTRALVEAISKAAEKPKVLINASAIGYYGDVPDGTVTENHKKGDGFLPDICDLWEKEAIKAESLGVRVVRLRIGIVLEKDGGALAKMLLPFKLGLGGPLGTGKQWMAWIHRNDMVNLIIHTLHNESLSGAINATAPNPVTMKEFASILGKNLHRPTFLPAPGFAIKLLLGEMSVILLGGQKVIPAKLQASGFQFEYAYLDQALQAILK